MNSGNEAAPKFLGNLVAVVDTSEPQREMFAAIAAGGLAANLAFNESVTVFFEGELDEPSLRKAVAALVVQHDALRSTFNRHGTQLIVHAELAPVYRYLDVSSDANAEQVLASERVAAVSEPFDLINGPLLRTVLLKTGAARYALVVSSHHIVCDGWSMAILLEDLSKLYSALVTQRPPVLEGTQYYVQYLQYLKSDAYQRPAGEDSNYWLNLFRNSTPVLDLPADYVRPPVRTFNADRRDLLLSPELVAQVKRLGAAHKSSFVATLLMAYAALLARLTGQNELVIGMPSAGQAVDSRERLVGHCVNTLPIRCTLDPKKSFGENLATVRTGLFDSYDHQRLTFGQLVARLGMARDPARIPLVQTLFNLDTGIQNMDFSGLKAWHRSNPRIGESFELFLNAVIADDGVLLECQFNTDLYSAATIDRWLGIFEGLLRQFVQNPQLPLGAYAVTSDADAQIWQRINATARDYPRDRGVHTLLAESIAARPQATLAFGNESSTHADLDRRAGRIAHTLQTLGVGPGQFVGICLDRSLDMLAALLGVLKAGAAYVPLDPEYPAERLQLMIDDSGLRTLLTAGSVPDGLITDKLSHVIDLSSIADSGEVAAVAIDPATAAYVIYTSGSTGKPKGVVVPHRTVVNFLVGMAAEPGLKPADRLLAVTTISFDIAVLELLLPLYVGAHLCIASREETKDGYRLLERMQQQEINAMQATPSTWRLLFAAGWQGGPGFKVLTGGEALPQNLADELLSKVGSVWNMYGPTETTVWSTVARVLPGTPVTLGRPIANTVLRITDATGIDTPVGVPGELLIGGEGVTLGYWQRPELNADRFIDAKGTRYYRTGDLVKLTATGELIYLGRMDNQVKLRGYRIELGEIESRLAELPGIAEAVVVVQSFGEGDQRLVAFYRQRLNSTLDVPQLRAHLAAKLPSFMVPQQFTELNQFPQTPNGKVDRKTLTLQTGIVNQTAEASASDGPVDPVILQEFRSFLQQPQLGVHADFFQSGGHSLLAMRMVAEINKKLGCQLLLTDLFQASTASALSALLAQKISEAAPAPIQIPRKENDRSRFLASLQQRRLWYLERFEDSGIEYNLPACWSLRGEMNVDALRQAFDALFARHDALRTRLVEYDDDLFQVIQPPRAGLLTVESLESEPTAERMPKLEQILNERKAHHFDLANEDLYQASLYRLSPTEHVLFVLVHHSIFDGWSFDIMLAELAEIYNAQLEQRSPQLAELPVQYGDFSEWMRQRSESSDEAGLKYWLQHLAGELPVLDLPSETGRPAIQQHRGAAIDFILDAESMAALGDFARQQGITRYMALMAIYKVLLWRYSGQRDVIVGTPISGRNFADINNLIGFFVNMLPLRDQIDPNQPVSLLLQQVKRTCLDGFARQEVPFERLVEHLKPPRDPSRSPIFQVMLMYQDISNRTQNFAGIKRGQINLDRPGVQTDLDFWLKWDGTVMYAGFEYDRDLLGRDTVEAMVADLTELVRRLPRMGDRSLWELADLPSPQLQAALDKLNATATPLPEPALVHGLFEQQATRTPDAIATRYRNLRVSYAELDARANRVAHWLDAQKIQPGAMVGVALAPSDWLQVVLLGVLKHGSTYVPIDPQFPVERIRYMIENSELAQLICDDTLDQKIMADAVAPTILLATLRGALEALPAVSLQRPIDPETPAYVIYTSGSTGLPKGVVVKHRGVANYLRSMQQRPGFAEDDRILAVTTLSFDIAVTELFLPLMCGGSSLLVDRDVAIDGELLREVIDANDINVLQATPSSWRLLLGADWRGNSQFKALCGGEALPPELIEQLLPKVGELWNVYGPTETTVWSTCHRVTGLDDSGLIGTPLANTTCYIVDEQTRAVPLGVIGELCIGGAGVAAGYLKRPDLTVERFIENPFGEGKLYRTGDLARLRSDGVIEYFGRSDHQVKVRGYRIELGEIESALAQHPGIAQAVTVAREFQDGDMRLVAYVVPRKQQVLQSHEVRTFLRDYLPSYMLPQHIMALDALPMTPNLKIDRKALPEPIVEDNVNARLPSSDNEQLLAAIWRDVLHIDSIVLEENFFDAGGHSLTAVDAIRRVHQQTGHRFEVREFIMETLEQLAAKLDSTKAAAVSPVPVAAMPTSKGFVGRLMKRLGQQDNKR